MFFFFFSTDEIMHQDIIPLYAADIHDQLKKQFAYLSGKTVMFPYPYTTHMYGRACWDLTVSDFPYRTNLFFMNNSE